VDLLGEKIMFLTLENHDVKAVLLSKGNSILIWKQYATHSSL
jgi:hypothetical protein